VSTRGRSQQRERPARHVHGNGNAQQRVAAAGDPRGDSGEVPRVIYRAGDGTSTSWPSAPGQWMQADLNVAVRVMLP